MVYIYSSPSSSRSPSPPPTPETPFSDVWVQCVADTRADQIHKAWWGRDLESETKRADFTSLPNPHPVGVSGGEIVSPSPEFRLLRLGYNLYDENAVNAPCDIVVRDEYDLAISVLQTASREYHTPGVVVTGQPGIGKTFFLWYLLRYRLSHSLPTMFQLNNGVPYLFNKNGVYEQGNHRRADTADLADAACFECEAGQGDLWSLIDMGTVNAEPYDKVTGGLVFIVQTAPLDNSTYKNWAFGDTLNGAQVFVLNPWSWDEIVAGLTVQDHPQAPKDGSNYKRLRELYDRYGPVPHTIYAVYLDPTDVVAADMDRETLRAMSEGARLLEHPTSLPENVWSKVICVWRNGPEIRGWCLRPLSLYIKPQLLALDSSSERSTGYWRLLAAHDQRVLLQTTVIFS